MTGGRGGSRGGGRPLAVAELRPGTWFGPWKVLRTGLRTGQTEKFPYGHRSAEIECKCGKTRTEREARLPAYDKAGPECRHDRTQRAPATPRPRKTPAATTLPPGWDDVRKPKPPPRPGSRRQHTRTRVPLPVSEIEPGKQIGDWEVTDTGLTLHGRHVVKLKCLTCGRKRATPRGVVTGGRMKPCSHAPRKRRPPTQGQAQVLRWMQEHAPGRAVSVTEVAAATGLLKSSVGLWLKWLGAAGAITQPIPGSWALPGVTVTSPAPDPGPDQIRAFLAADGGATFGEILAATGMTVSAAYTHLATLARRGQVTHLQDTGGRFYLLPGQEPGEIVTLG